MASVDREIEQLYQRPLSEFTNARDELAKRTPSGRAAIRRLQKPNVPAWAVNQLYWRERETYDRLVAAAERARKAQVDALAGKQADVAKAEVAHAAAKRSAMERVRAIAKDAGETLSAAAAHAVSETLDALPTADPPGRLTRPLKPMGFEALAGLLHGRPIAKRGGQVLPFRPTAAPPATRSAAASKRDAEQRKRAAAVRATKLRHALSVEKSTASELKRAQTALAAAERERDHLTERLEASRARVEALSAKAAALAKDAAAARSAREALEAEG